MKKFRNTADSIIPLSFIILLLLGWEYTVKLRSWLIEVFKAINPTVMFITHDVDEALYLCDRIYALSCCPTVVKVEVSVPFRRPPHGRTIVDPEYGAVRDKVMEALEI